jgi:hypothetical protein
VGAVWLGHARHPRRGNGELRRRQPLGRFTAQGEGRLQSHHRAHHDDGARGDHCHRTRDFCTRKPGSAGGAHGAAHDYDVASSAGRQPRPRCNGGAAACAAARAAAPTAGYDARAAGYDAHAAGYDASAAAVNVDVVAGTLAEFDG